MYRYSILLLVLTIIVSCFTREVSVEKSDIVQDNKYDSEYPSIPVGNEIEKIIATVKLVSSLSFYKQYYFTSEQKITLDKLERGLKDNEKSAIIVEQPASGTATIIHSDINQVALLTCAHTISSPDTIIYYFLREDGKPSPIIESVGVKVRQSLNVIGLPRGEKITILASDSELDLAILGKRLSVNTPIAPKAFSYPIGSAKELQWGTFVYLIGFPHGKKMITNTIVSNPNPSKKNNFIINATMYKGVSGGIILALRDGVPNFELVGIANALSAQQYIKLIPAPLLNIDTINPTQPYNGEIFLDREIKIIDGITFAIPAETIKIFLDKSRKELAAKGYRIGKF